jgi:hypothetical protein
MGLEWVLLSLLMAVALWLGMDACRESKRLHARLSRVRAQRRTGRDRQPGRDKQSAGDKQSGGDKQSSGDKQSGGDWAYWPLTTAATEDLRMGPRF